MKNQLTKTPYLVLFIILIAIGVGTASALVTITLSGDVVITGFLDMTSDKITNVGTPTLSSDAVNKGYVDSVPDADTLSDLGCAERETVQLVENVWTCVKLTVKNNLITTVDSTGEVGTHTSIAIGSDNNPVISYHSEDPTYDLKVVHCGNTSCSSDNTITTLDSTNTTGSSTSLAIGIDGFPVISYSDVSNSDINVIHCGNALCSSGNNITTIDGTTGTGGSPTSIAIGSDNNPVVAYRAFAGGHLKIVHCGDVDCAENTNSNTVTTLDSPGDVGTPSIAIGSDNNPIISYSNESPSFDLKVVHCTNVSCSSFDTPFTIESTDSVGRYSSLAIGADGLPVISYFHQTLGDLKVVHCTNMSCTTFGAPVTIDSSADVGRYSSLAIGADGLPVISYQDSTFNNLKVAHCGSLACWPPDGNNIITLDGTSEVGQYTSIAIGIDNLPIISYSDSVLDDLKVTVMGPVVALE